MPAEPWSLGFLRSQWVEKMLDHRRFQSDQTEMRAITAERRYVFAWRRWRQKLVGRQRPHAVKRKDPAVGWGGGEIIMIPYKHIWLVLWADQDTQRSGVHGVFNDEDDARCAVERLNYTSRRVYRVEQWPIL